MTVVTNKSSVDEDGWVIWQVADSELLKQKEEAAAE